MNSISVSCYNHYDLRHLSLDELISSWNELTVNINKEAKQKQELEANIQELESKQKEQENRIEELDDEVLMEREEAEKALGAAMKWRKRQMAEAVLKHMLQSRSNRFIEE